MAEIPESLLRRSAEAKAKALGVPVEQVLAEMKGEAPPPSSSSLPPAAATPAPTPTAEPASQPAEPPESEPVSESAEPVSESAEHASGSASESQPEPEPAGVPEPASPVESAPAAEPEAVPPAAAVAVEDAEPPAPPVTGDGGNGRTGNGATRVAASVSARPMAPPTNAPEGVRTQRLLTVVKARAIQNVKAEPSDKVNTWPHLMIAEFTALLAMTAFLLVLSVILHAPLLEPANFNATPNPSKAPWYFLGLQELLSYFDPQIAGVTIPTVIGLIGFFLIPYIDRNPSTRPSDRKFAIMLYTIFLTGAATLTLLGVLFRGQGFNFSYPWRDGIYFDDLKDWVPIGLGGGH